MPLLHRNAGIEATYAVSFLQLSRILSTVSGSAQQVVSETLIDFMPMRSSMVSLAGIK